MAGTATLALHNSARLSITDRMTLFGPSVLHTMNEGDVYEQLSEQSFDKRKDILEYLTELVRRNGGRLPFDNKKRIFMGLALAFNDSHWDVRHDCTSFIREVIPQLGSEGSELDDCMSAILPQLVCNIGDSKTTVRRDAIQTIHVYMQHTRNMQLIFRALVSHGIDSAYSRIRKEVITGLPVLLTDEFCTEDFSEVVQALGRRLLDSATEQGLQQLLLTCFDKIQNLVGPEVFINYIEKLTPHIRQNYLKLVSPNDSFDIDYSETDNDPVPEAPKFYSSNEKLVFGFVPSSIIAKINDQDDFRVKAEGVEELKQLFENFDLGMYSDANFTNFIKFLSTLLDDSSVKISSATLEIIGLLVSKLGHDISPHLKTITDALTKRMGDNKVVVKQAIMKVIMKLMQMLTARDVLKYLLNNLKSKAPRVRQETLNAIIAALLTFPSYDFDSDAICNEVAATLNDNKRPVRQASLECCAALASSMGAIKKQQLIRVVDSYGNAEMSAAVQARLSRRQLPKLNADGLVEYTMPLSAQSARVGSSQGAGADIDWILAAAGGSSSLSVQRSLQAEPSESDLSVLRRSPPPALSEGSTPRRHVSSGRAKNKLPWNDDSTNGNKPQLNSYSVDLAYQTQGNGGSDDDIRDTYSKVKDKKDRRSWKSTSKEELASTGNSYREIHMPRYKRQMSDGTPPLAPHAAYQGQGYQGGSESDDDARLVAGAGDTDTGGKYTRYHLEPITDQKHAADWAFGEGSKSGSSGHIGDSNPVPVRATLARGGSSKRRMPSINKTEQQAAWHDNSVKVKGGFGDGIEHPNHEEAEEMKNSLKQIRSSASKKKVEMLFNQVEKEQSDLVHGDVGTQRSQYSDDMVTSKLTARKSDYDTKAKTKKGGNSPSDAQQFDFESRRDSSTNNMPLDVHVRGYGYADEGQGQGNDVRAAAGLIKRKKPKNAQLQMGYPYSQSQSDMLESNMPSAVVGVGMFDYNSQAMGGGAMNGDNGEWRQQRDHRRKSRAAGGGQHLQDGVVGVGVLSGASYPYTGGMGGPYSGPGDGDEDVAPMSFSANLRRTEARKKMEAQRQDSAGNERRFDGDDQPWSDEPGVNVAGDDGNKNYLRKNQGKYAYGAQKSPSAKKTTEEKSATGPLRSTGEPEDPANMKPFKDPNRALAEAVSYMANEEWEIKCSGLNYIRRLAKHHPKTLLEQLHSTVVVLLKEVKNLRSQVGRLAVITMGDMFGWLNKSMDSEADQCCRVLLDKTGETNNFIRDAAMQALTVMADSVTPQRAMLALITNGTSHKNASVRRTASQLLVTVVEKLGTGRVLSGIKDMTDRVLPVTAQLLLDGQPETRYNASKIFYMLMSHDDFDAMMNKYVSPSTMRNIQDKLDTIRKKGLGNPPSESMSASTRRPGQQRSRSDYRENTDPGDDVSEGVRSYSSNHVGRGRGTSEIPSEEVKATIGLLGSNDWRDRQRGIGQLQEMVDAAPDAVGQNIVKILDKFNPCLKDSNSKVNLQALQVMSTIVPPLAQYLSQSQVIGNTIQTVVPNLSSGNRDIYNEAVSVLDAITEHVDHSILLQPFASQALNGNVRIKPDMVHRLAFLASDVYDRKPKQVTMHVLPLLWHLLSLSSTSAAAGSTDLRQATSELAISLHGAMGDSLMEAALASPGMSPRLVQQLQDILDGDDSR